jgi:hypothetical protein
MPGFDGTGPLGLGPRTGRGLGPCGAGRAYRRRWGRRGDYGLGYRRFASPKDELAALEEEEEILKEELEVIRKEKENLKGQQK